MEDLNADSFFDRFDDFITVKKVDEAKQNEPTVRKSLEKMFQMCNSNHIQKPQLQKNPRKQSENSIERIKTQETLHKNGPPTAVRNNSLNQLKNFFQQKVEFSNKPTLSHTRPKNISFHQNVDRTPQQFMNQQQSYLFMRQLTKKASGKENNSFQNLNNHSLDKTGNKSLSRESKSYISNIFKKVSIDMNDETISKLTKRPPSQQNQRVNQNQSLIEGSQQRSRQNSSKKQNLQTAARVNQRQVSFYQNSSKSILDQATQKVMRSESIKGIIMKENYISMKFEEFKMKHMRM